MATVVGLPHGGVAPSPRTDSVTPPGISIAEAIVALSPMAVMT